jgi:hypothetical protein
LDGGVAALQELNAFERIAESRIQEAMRNGEMDVSKKGSLDERSDLDSPEAIAAKVVGNANITPAWLQEEKQLRTTVSALRGRLACGGDISQKEIEDVNAATRRFNLNCPPRFQRRLFDRDFETSVDTSRSRGWGAAGSRNGPALSESPSRSRFPRPVPVDRLWRPPAVGASRIDSATFDATRPLTATSAVAGGKKPGVFMIAMSFFFFLDRLCTVPRVLQTTANV